jgi:NitT/TauT family transport system ATP-binding protein
MFPSEGELLFRGKKITGVNRNIGYVFQQDSLYPWRTLRDNVALSLEIQGVSSGERRARADKWLERTGLKGFENAYCYELSGGMRQRGNIVRTLIYEPEVILMDEPFGPLDAQTRIVLQDQLLDIWHSTKTTIIFVTHDLTEAIALADRVALMGASGQIVRMDKVNIPRPRDVFFIHDDNEFRLLYDEIWKELESQVHGRKKPIDLGD